MANIIPGAAVLGCGFDIFGGYSEESLQRPLMNVGGAFTPWTAPNGTVLEVPDNASLNPATATSGSASAFESKQTYTSHYAAKANVRGSYGAFSAEFEAAFSHEEQSEAEYSYGLYELQATTWTLTLINQTVGALLPDVLSDPDYTNLPSAYSQENEYLFFRFFAKYGTHFVDRVVCGGSMSYCAAVSKQFSSQNTTISAKLTLEFGGVFGSAGATAEADFAAAGTAWFENRTVSIRSLGGNTNVLAGIVPSDGTSNNAAFESWLGSIASEPAPTQFALSPIASLFSGDRAAAVQQAYEAYANSRLYAEARHDTCTLLLSGTPVHGPVTQFTSGNGQPTAHMGVLVALIDRTDLNLALARRYDIAVAYEWPNTLIATCNQLFEALYSDLNGYAGESQYLLALTTYNWWGCGYPTPNAYGLLLSCGAGSGLHEWRTHWSATGTINDVNYSLLGIVGCGPDAGIEAFVSEPDSQRTAATAMGLLIPTSSGQGEEQIQFDLLPA
jgi:hypothetical protein